MKFSRPTLMLVALNVAWLAALSYFLMQRQRLNSAAAEVHIVTNYVPVAQPSSQPLTVVTNVVVAGTNDFRWQQLESEDYRSYVARLRAIGCPEQTIRDIIIADVDKLLAPKMFAASGRTNAITYWQPIEQDSGDSSERKEALQKQRAVDFEKREVVRELLGVDLVGERLRNQGFDDYYGERLSFLPEEKRARARTLLEQFSDQERTLLEEQIENDGTLAATEELSQLQRQRDAALAQLLTPEEQAQYDLWFSPNAAATRESVYGMNASEEEFLKLYQLRQEFAARHGQEFSAQADVAQEFNKAAQQALGEARYAEYSRSQDPDYRELLRVTKRFKLSPEVAAQLYSYKQPIEEERARVDAEPNLTPLQKTAAHEAIANEAQHAFREALGDKAFKHFVSRSRNSWVRNSPRPAAPQP